MPLTSHIMAKSSTSREWIIYLVLLCHRKQVHIKMCSLCSPTMDKNQHKYLKSPLIYCFCDKLVCYHAIIVPSVIWTPQRWNDVPLLTLFLQVQVMPDKLLRNDYYQFFLCHLLHYQKNSIECGHVYRSSNENPVIVFPLHFHAWNALNFICHSSSSTVYWFSLLEIEKWHCWLNLILL